MNISAPFNESTLLVDLTCLDLFVREMTSGDLLTEGAAPHYQSKLQAGDHNYKELFEFLSSYICFERFVIDKRALYSFQDAQRTLDAIERADLSIHFSLFEFPFAAYQSAIAGLTKLAQSLILNAPKSANKNDIRRLEDLLGYEKTRFVDDASLKDMYDRRYFLERPDFKGELPRNFAETGMSVERLFVYLEVARLSKVPALLAAGKYDALREVGKRVGRNAARLLRDQEQSLPAGTKTGLAEIELALTKAALPKIKLRSPLLPSHILRVSEIRKCSIWEAVRLIRNDPCAAEFRKYIWRSRAALDPVGASDHLKTRAIQDELADIGARIRRGGSNLGVFTETRKLTVSSSNIPVMGFLLDLMGLGKIDIPLNMPRAVPKYEIFMARWFV